MASRPPQVYGIGGSSAPMQSAMPQQFFVPSWIRSDTQDVRGRDPFARIALTPGANYRLVDYTGENEGRVLASGSTPEELAAIQRIVNEQLVPQGRKADWRLQVATDPMSGIGGFSTNSGIDPTTGQYYQTIGGDYYNRPSVAGTALDIGLPLIATGLLGPLGFLGAAATSGLSSAIQGRSLEDALLRAGIAGGVSFGMDKFGVNQALGSALSGGKGGAISGAAGNVAGSAAGSTAAQQAAAQIAQAIPGEILVTAARQAAPSVLGNLASSAVGAGLGSIGSSLVQPDSFQQQMELARMRNQYAPEETVVTGSRIPQAVVPPAAIAIPAVAGGAAALSSLSEAGQAAMQTDTTASQQAENAPQDSTSAAAAKKPMTASDYIRAGLGGISAIQGVAGLLGAGGGGGAGTDLISNQGALPQFAPLNRARRAVDFDPFTYGQRSGEFQFFENNTLPALAAAPMKRGGPVSGIGGGQDDKIPALLSDGEYVISAQDVSDLGDGSNEEGARRLDEMRKMIRKGAGRKNIRSIAKPQKDVKSLLRAVK